MFVVVRLIKMQGSAGSISRDVNNNDSGTKLLVLGSPEGSSYTMDRVFLVFRSSVCALLVLVCL